MSDLKLSDFSFIQKLGEGGFGRAFLVKKKSDGKRYCLKQMELPSDGPYVFAALYCVLSLKLFLFCCIKGEKCEEPTRSINSAHNSFSIHC